MFLAVYLPFSHHIIVTAWSRIHFLVRPYQFLWDRDIYTLCILITIFYTIVTKINFLETMFSLLIGSNVAKIFKTY